MKKIFVLVWVHRGFIQKPEIYSTLKGAERRMSAIKQSGFNQDYDEIEIFEESL